MLYSPFFTFNFFFRTQTRAAMRLYMSRECFCEEAQLVGISDSSTRGKEEDITCAKFAHTTRHGSIEGKQQIFSFLIVDSSIIHHPSALRHQTSSISPQPSDILHLTGRGFFSFYFVVSTFMPNFAECHRTGKECVMCEG